MNRRPAGQPPSGPFGDLTARGSWYWLARRSPTPPESSRMKPSLRRLTLLAVRARRSCSRRPGGRGRHDQLAGVPARPRTLLLSARTRRRSRRTMWEGSLRSWHWQPGPPTKPGQPSQYLFASPTVYDGSVYIGSNTGVFTALDEATGHVEWKRFLGFVPDPHVLQARHHLDRSGRDGPRRSVSRSSTWEAGTEALRAQDLRRQRRVEGHRREDRREAGQERRIQLGITHRCRRARLPRHVVSMRHPAHPGRRSGVRRPDRSAAGNLLHRSCGRIGGSVWSSQA